MGDQLERFINENRNHFDDENVSKELWNKINKDLDKSGSNSFSWVWKVAAILLLTSTLYLSYDKFIKSDELVISEAMAEFQQAEAFYSSMINEKRLEIEEIVTEDLRLEFVSEVDHLNSMYEDLKEEFDENSSDQKLVDAMISNLQIRIQILNEQLSILKRLNETKNENEESINI